MTTSRKLLTLLVLASAWVPGRAQDEAGGGGGTGTINKVDSSDPANKTWVTAKKTYYYNNYKVALKNGTVLLGSEPFKVKDGRAVFHVLVNWREGPLASIPIDEVDLPSTERLNQPKPEPPMETTPPQTFANLPVFETREMGALVESDKMKVERERIRKLRESQSQQEYQDYLAAQKAQNPKAEGSGSEPRGSAVSAEHMMLAKDRKVQKGMNGMAVVLSWGDPDKKEPVAENAAQERWTYLVKGREPYFLTFEGDSLVQIQNGERLLYTASLDEIVPPKDDAK